MFSRWFALVEERQYPLNPIDKTKQTSSKNSLLYFRGGQLLQTFRNLWSFSYELHNLLIGPFPLNLQFYMGRGTVSCYSKYILLAFPSSSQDGGHSSRHHKYSRQKDGRSDASHDHSSFKKAKAFPETCQKTFSVQNCVTWAPLAMREAGKASGLALSAYIVEVSKEERVWQWVDGLPINNVAVGPKGWASQKAPPHSAFPVSQRGTAFAFHSLFLLYSRQIRLSSQWLSSIHFLQY